MENFLQQLINGITLHRARIAAYVNNSLMLVTALSPKIGYDKAAEIAKHAHAHLMTLREAALSLGYIDGERYDALVDPAKMTKPTR